MSVLLLIGLICVLVLLRPQLLAAATDAPGDIEPPVAAQRPVVLEKHGDRRVDEYHWLRDRDDPEVIAYLQAENAYADAMLAHTAELQRTLYAEMVARIKETDLSVPYRKGQHLYYSRTEQGKQYRWHCRKRGSVDAAEEIILDENALAEGQKYFKVGVLETSPDGKLLAYSTDTAGDERFSLRLRSLETGAEYPESIPDTYDSVAWASDNATVFYTVLDAAHRPYRVCRHRVGTDPAADALVFEEADERFFARVSRCRSGRFVFIELGSHVTDEAWFLAADDPEGVFRMIEPRFQDVEYRVSHHGERFFIVTNEGGATNFKLVEAPIGTPGRKYWREVIPHREDVFLCGADAFREHLVIHQRVAGLPAIRIRQLRNGAEHSVAFEEPAYAVAAAENEEFDTRLLRFQYSSLVTPNSVYDYDMESRERTLLKRTEVLGGYDPDNYVVERIQAPARDGLRVPISLVYRRGLVRDGDNPTFLYGYGSYGINNEARFSSPRFSLIDRGAVFAIAHVRGGSELGRRWYEDGKYGKKWNTFHDFIDCAEHLVAERITSPKRLAIGGGSAGGLLMGAVTNARPDLFFAVLAQVPFVDIVTTMLDDTLPLTVIEYEEWGNPNEKKWYDVMKSYSPYDNVRAQNYPHMLIKGGLNDPRVGFWEPAKWCARLRARRTGDGLLLLKTNMGAGHGGASGRYDYLEELAFEYAFLIDRFGI